MEAENSLTAPRWPGSISSRGCPSQQSLEFHSQRRWAGPKPETGQGWALLEANQLLHPPQEQHGAGMYLGLGAWLCALGRPPNFSKPCFSTYKTATAISVGELSEPDSGPGAQCPVCWALMPCTWLGTRGSGCEGEVGCGMCAPSWAAAFPICLSLGRTWV